jgi:phospholipase C
MPKSSDCVLPVKRSAIIAFGMIFLFLFGARSFTINVAVNEGGTQSPIQHLIVIMQENRPFDNFFWTFPGAMGNFQTDSRECMPDNPPRARPCTKPIQVTSPSSKDLAHGWTSSWQAYDKGKMDGFVAAEGCTCTMDYYTKATIPYVWDFAANYTLSDMMFSSVKSYSQPNHWFMLSGQAPVVSITEYGAQEKKQCVNNGEITWSTCYYINQAQKISTMPDLLAEKGITWKYYDVPPEPTLDQAILSGNANAYWNPLLAKNETYTNSQFGSNVVARADFFTDLNNGALPNISWVIPSAPISDHPPANVTLGEWWIDYVISSVMQSKYWNSTAIVLMWDDYGGFFDTIAPPTVSDNENMTKDVGLGFRVPAVIISPYSRAGYIDNTVYDFESTLAFIEWNWNLPPLGIRDSMANNMTDAFNFTQKPLPGVYTPLTQSQLQTILPYVNIGNAGYPKNALLASVVNNLTSQFIGGDLD